MNFFRSEEHVSRWLAGREPGATISVGKLCELAHAWRDDRLSPHWQPHSRGDNQAILDRLGLTGRFWRLPDAYPPRARGRRVQPAGCHHGKGC